MTLIEQFRAGVELAENHEAMSDFGLYEAGVVLVAVGTGAAVYQGIRSWIKRKGFRMVLKDRNDKKHALLLDILTDGIEGAVVKGTISNKEADEMYRELQKKMGLNDLVPKKRLQRMVKEDIKRARVRRGLPPIPVVKKVSQRLGNAAMFWRKTEA